MAVLCGRVAAAAPTVIIADTRDAPALPTLRSQVEIHVGDRATVQTLSSREADPMTYAARATELVASGQATIVVWIAPVEGGYLVFAAGSWPGRALIELVRVDATVGPAEIERTIALKIAGLLDTMLAQEVAPAVGVTGVPEPAVVVVKPLARWRIAVEGLVAYEAHERGADGRVGLAVSRGWHGGGWRIAPTLSAYWQPSGAIERAHGRASITEPGVALGLEIGRRAAQLEVFARPRIVGALIVARGASEDGRQGEVTVVAPYAGLDLGVRYPISPAAWVGVVAGGDLALIHHEFLIDRATIVDLGRLRVHVGLALTVGL